MHAGLTAGVEGPTAPRSGISVVYPTRDRPELLVQSLAALLRNSVLPDEILVIDQSRTDATRVAIGRLNSPLIRHVASDEVGVSRAKNTGIRVSRFSAIGFIDDDCVPARTWIESARRAMQRWSESSVWVGGVYSDPDVISDDALATSPETFVHLKGTNDPWRIGPAGGNSFFRRRTFDLVGSFDPLLGPGSRFLGCEDGDMLYRVFRANLQVTYSDRIRLHHLQWRDDEEEVQNSYRYGLGFGAMVAKYAVRHDYYPATVIFVRRFLPNYFLVPVCLLLGQRRKFRHSLNWSEGMIKGFAAGIRFYRARSEVAA